VTYKECSERDVKGGDGSLNEAGTGYCLIFGENNKIEKYKSQFLHGDELGF
jgi:hypothetical protein